jgi:hypothetical protein
MESQIINPLGFKTVGSHSGSGLLINLLRTQLMGCGRPMYFLPLMRLHISAVEKAGLSSQRLRRAMQRAATSIAETDGRGLPLEDRDVSRRGKTSIGFFEGKRRQSLSVVTAECFA